MQNMNTITRISAAGILLTVLATLSLSGCGSGPAVEARSQTISFQAAPALALGGSATVAATASSGLAISYSSTTPQVCSVDGASGAVTANSAGTCVIAANQPGNSNFAPAPQVTQSIPVSVNPGQTISFGTAPALSLGGTAVVSAIASSGLSVSYSSATPQVCSVDAGSGLVTDLTTGTCTIAADQAGNASFSAAPQVTQSMLVSVPTGITVPGAPSGVSATAGASANSVVVGIGATDSGGSPIRGYTVISSPAGITVTGSASPVSVTCPSSCSGFAFSVFASNAVGNGALSAPADVVTAYDVLETFFEPDTQPNNSVFIGSFIFNSTTGTVSNLRGILTESMTGGAVAFPNDTMTRLSLTNQLSSVPVTLGGADGLLVTTFLLTNTNTFTTDPALGGTDGWSPGTGFGWYFGFPGVNPGNAYARIFVNTANPTAALNQAQLDKLAYADCAPGGMMGRACMTGTTVAGYGVIGTMSGFPVSQVITRH